MDRYISPSHRSPSTKSASVPLIPGEPSLRILAEGEVAAGDPFQMVHRPAHGLTVAEVAAIYHCDHARAPRLLEAPELAESWRQWAASRVAARAPTGGPPARGNGVSAAGRPRRPGPHRRHSPEHGRPARTSNPDPSGSS
jgi:hypothetical protein